MVLRLGAVPRPCCQGRVSLVLADPALPARPAEELAPSIVISLHVPRINDQRRELPE